MTPLRIRFRRLPARAAAVAAVFIAGLLPAAARAQYFGQNKVQYQTFRFRVLATEHFDIYYYNDERVVAEEAGRMAERWYGRLSRSLDTELHGRQPLILYASHPDFEQTNAVSGELDESTGGVTESFKRRIVLPVAATLGETDHVIGHELVHAFQYDLKRRGQSNPFDPSSQMPLWFIEGMAEYLSIGRDDPHTAMWIRDAARTNKLPTIAKLDNPKYFPYRFGEALWAYVAARFGEASVGQVLKAASSRGIHADQALSSALGIPADSLSRDWQRAIRDWAAEVDTSRRADAQGRVVVAPRGERGRLNVGPSLSPDGRFFTFLSERDALSIELFLADAQTGHVLRRLTRSAVDPHLQSLQFIHSAGDWSPDGRRVAIATVTRGEPALAVINAANGRIVRQIRFPTLGEVFHPAWSPDGRRIAFSGLAGGATDLFLVDVESRKVERLTNDLYADLQPSWSPDGRTLAFATDRFGTRLGTLEYGDLRLALLDLESHAIREVPGVPGGKSINPQWSRDGASLYFLSDRDGISNVYRITLADSAVSQITDVATGVSGITRLSPALSVARGVDRMLFSVYENGGYTLRMLDTEAALAGFAPDRPIPGAGVLPPAAADTVAIAARDETTLADTSAFHHVGYRAGLSLDYAAQAGIGVAAGSGGVAVGGGSALYWSDMLGDHNLATIIQMNGSEGGVSRNLGAVIDYENRSRRWNWGIQGYQFPYFTSYYTQDEGTLNGAPAFRQREYRAWQIERALEASIYYPINRAQRFEFSTGYHNIDFTGDVRTLIYSGNDGTLLSDETTAGPEDSIPSLDLFTVGAAAVYDNSVFGGTSPVAGQRYRLEFSPVMGGLEFANVLGDYRRYVRVAGPLRFAGRLVHVGRYGRDSESSTLGPLFVGYPWLIRGYDISTFSAAEPVPDGLFGSRLGIANFELRLPLFGALGVVHSPQVPPVEIAGFYDAGAAWNEGNRARFLGGSVPGVSSYGGALRINLLGFAVGEIDYVHPDDRPLKGWFWQFNLQPGF